MAFDPSLPIMTLRTMKTGRDKSYWNGAQFCGDYIRCYIPLRVLYDEDGGGWGGPHAKGCTPEELKEDMDDQLAIHDLVEPMLTIGRADQNVYQLKLVGWRQATGQEIEERDAILAAEAEKKTKDNEHWAGQRYARYLEMLREFDPEHYERVLERQKALI